jgi:two-component system sensor histidine kinase PrrB
VRLATRTGLASLAAAVLALVLLALVAATQFENVLRDLVDEQLEDRAGTAPILAAVGDRVAVSELDTTIGGARVLIDGRTIDVGRLPADALPDVGPLGFRTARADGEDWRLYALEIDDVPEVGDTSVVELAAPLGDVDARVRILRRRLVFAGLITTGLAGLAGLVLGRRAARPLTDLRDDAARLSDGTDADRQLRERYGTVEVDDVAAALRSGLAQVAAASERREEALVASRAFAASATHELRTPLQSAMTNLDIDLTAGTRDPVVSARSDLDRMRSALDAVRAFSDAELVDPSWFTTVDLADLVEEVVAQAGRTSDGVTIAGAPSFDAAVWPDGVRLALDNLIRNAVTHGRSVTREESEVGGAAQADGTSAAAESARVVVTIDADRSALIVDDAGPGVDNAHRHRLVQPFERGDTDESGSGLGLAFAERVAVAHGGRLILEDSPLGGLRVTLVLGSDG